MKYEVCIIGGGPAGMGCALKLASVGIPSVVLEKEKMPREKICGDGLSGRSIEALSRIGHGLIQELDRHPGAQPSWGVKFVSPAGKEVELSYRENNSGKPSGYVIRRRDFDEILAGKCKEHPLIRFREGFEVTGAEKGEGGWFIKGKDSKDNAPFPLVLIAAGNRSGKIMSHFGCQPEETPERPGLAVRTYYEGVGGTGNNFPIEIHFYKELLPWYFWIFPLPGGIVNTGLGMLYRQAIRSEKSLKQMFYWLVENKPGLRERFKGARQLEGIKADRIDHYQVRQTLAGDGYLVLGDAAQLIDPFTGEGIGNALFSGIRAAETVKRCMDSGNFGHEMTKVYEEAIYRTMQPELELGLRLRERAQQGWLINLVVSKAGRSRSAREGLKKMIYDANNMKDLRNPMYYLKVILNL